MSLFSNFKKILYRTHFYPVLILPLFLVIILTYISYQELIREKNYLWELAQSEGLNIAYSIQTLGPEFILNQNVLQEILDLFQKEGIAFIDVVDRNGLIRISTDQQRINSQTVIHYPGVIHYIQSRDSENRRIMQIIKPFDFDRLMSSDLFGYLFLHDKYLQIGIHLEKYDHRYDQIKRRVLLNYIIILIIICLGLYILFRLQKDVIIKRTLAEMKDYTAKILENVDSGVFSVNQKNSIQTFNRKSEEIFHLNRSEVIDRDARSLLPIHINGQSIYELGLNKGIKIEREIEFTTRDKHRKILEINTTLLSGEGNERSGMVVLVRDITHLKTLSEEINRNRRLTSLGKLSSGIAHEIRNPLSSIRGLAQFLYSSFKENDERKNDLQIILKEVDRLNHLVTQVLDFARPNNLCMSEFSIDELVEELFELMKGEAKDKDIIFELKKTTNQHQWQVEADRDKMKQVLMNILKNSIQAIPDRGEIKITLEKICLNNEKKIRMTIQDNGSGIQDSDLVHIFDPFFTTRSNGTGLGLSLAYNMIQMHNGNIQAYSQVGRGTEIKIIIPERRRTNN